MTGARARELAASPSVRLVLRVGTLLVAYLLLERWVTGLARLPAASYAEPVIALGVLERFLATPRLEPGYLLRVALATVLAVLLVLRPRRVAVSWSALASGPYLRLLVGVPALILAWAFATYDYNLYFDQPHLVDRLALVLLSGLVLWRPGFVLPFVVLAMAVVWQFSHPIGGFSVAQPFLLARWLLLFCAFFLLRTAGADHRPADFVLLALTLLAASYFVAGLGKLRVGWFGRGGVALLLPATYANGWLGFLDPGTVGAVTRRLTRADGLLVAGTFVVECGAVVALARRRVLLFFLCAWPLFHLSVFALTGILFWQWILLEVTLLVLLLKRPRIPALDVFSRRHALLALPLVAGGTVWFHPVDLTWHNAAVSYVYRFEGVGESGRRYSLPPGFFAPYDYQFTLGAFAYASPHRQLGVVWGATSDADVADAMGSARGAEDVATLELERGRRFLDEARARRLEAFLARFVGTWNRRRSRRALPVVPSAPPHLWTFPPEDAFDGGERLVRVVVWRVTSLFDGSTYRELDPRRLRSVEIPPAGGPPSEPSSR